MAGWLLLKTVPIIILGVILAEFIVSLGWVDRLSFLARPITRFSHLQDECGIIFLSAFASPTSANSMLANYYNKGVIEKKELFLAAMINTFPAILMHWRSMLPILLPLLGLAGLLYFLILVLVALVKTSLLMIVARLILKKRAASKTSIEKKKILPLKEAFCTALKNSNYTIKRIIMVIIPTLILSCLLIELGVFERLSHLLKGVILYFPIPSEGLGIVAAFLAHSNAAYTVAGSLLSAGELTQKGVVLSLLIGSVLSSVVMVFQYIMPYYIGIFGPKIGLQLVGISEIIRNGITIIFIFGLAIFW
ncbi:MAG: nucleoside recognition domain-containing protein [bacterium]